MDTNEKLDRLESKFDRMLLLIENMDKGFNARFDKLEQKVEKVEQDIAVLKQQNAALTEAINATNQNLTSKIDALDKKIDILEGQTNVNSLDIVKLRAAK